MYRKSHVDCLTAMFKGKKWVGRLGSGKPGLDSYGVFPIPVLGTHIGGR